MDVPGRGLDGAVPLLRPGAVVVGGGRVPALQNGHHLLAGDGLLLQQVGDYLVHVLPVGADDLLGLVVAAAEDLHHVLVDIGGGILGTVDAVAPVQILVAAGGQGHHAELVAHAVERHHIPGQAGGLLDILGRAVGHGVEDHLLGGPAAHEGGDLRQELVPGLEVLVLLRQVQGIPQRPLGVGDNGDLLHGGGVLLLEGHHGVAHLVIGHQPLFELGEHRVLLLRAGDDQLEGGQQVVLIHRPAAQADGPEGGLVDQVGQVRAHGAGGGQGDLVQVHVLRQADVAGMDLEGGQTSGQVGPVHRDAPVEAAGAQKGLVQHLRPVGGRQEDDALSGVKAVHLGQELVEGLLPLVVAAHAVVPGLADGVDLVDKDDAGGHLVGLFEEVADPAGAHAHEHLHKVGAADGEEGHVGLAGHGLGEEGLAGARRAHQQGALGELGADLRVLLGVVEEVDDLHQGLLGLVLAGHILEGDAGLFLHIDLGVGLAHAAQAAAHLPRHAPEEEGKDGHHQNHGHHIGDEDADDGVELGLIGVAVADAVLVHELEDVRVVDGGAVVTSGLGQALVHRQGVPRARDQLAPGLAGVQRFPAVLPRYVQRGVHVDADRRGVLLEVDGEFVVGGGHRVDLVLLHQLFKFAVTDLGGVGLGRHAGEIVHQNGDDQGPEHDGADGHQIAFVVIAGFTRFIGLQIAALLASKLDRKGVPWAAIPYIYNTSVGQIQETPPSKPVNFL